MYAVLIDSGVVSNSEVRKILLDNPESGFDNIDEELLGDDLKLEEIFEVANNVPENGTEKEEAQVPTNQI
jgi:hypothetical protein